MTNKGEDKRDVNIDNEDGYLKSDEIKICECRCVHEGVVADAKDGMPEEEVLYDLADLFKVLGDSTRIKILYALFADEMCVCDIASLLCMTDSAISHQLRVLKQARLVKARKDGKSVFYSLDDNHVRQIFNCGLCHIQE
ncbi:MAG: metalloregulator ArsR/SmtB family transcription factor [Clostridioides sp.]|nr:metalloregulator ArsR/SmtB family transcription factor [Clostridioides sp.]